MGFAIQHRDSKAVRCSDMLCASHARVLYVCTGTIQGAPFAQT